MISSIALALSAAAAVSALPTPKEQGIRIPITMNKRAGIRNAIAQGTFTEEEGRSYINRIAGKYAQSLDNYLRNTGSEHPLASGTAADRHALTKRQKEPLTAEGQGSFWQGNIVIGGQTIPVDFDTGSSDLWVPASDCTDTGCQAAKAKYDSSKSKTGKEVSKSGFTITYGDGSGASGPIWTETVQVGGQTATKQTFSPVSKDTIQQGTGLLGMGFESISSLKAAPFFQTLMDEKVVANGQFSFALTKQNAELYLGGSDKSLYTGDVTWLDLTQKSYWVTEGSVTAGGQGVLNNIPMIIDTGTSLLVGTNEQAQKFYQAIGGEQCTTSECKGYWLYPCEAKVAFKMGDATFDVSSTFSLGSVSGRYDGKCVGALVGTAQVPLNAMIVGDTFFSNVYTIFDQAAGKVGFAKIAA